MYSCVLLFSFFSQFYLILLKYFTLNSRSFEKFDFIFENYIRENFNRIRGKERKKKRMKFVNWASILPVYTLFKSKSLSFSILHEQNIWFSDRFFIRFSHAIFLMAACALFMLILLTRNVNSKEKKTKVCIVFVFLLFHFIFEKISNNITLLDENNGRTFFSVSFYAHLNNSLVSRVHHSHYIKTSKINLKKNKNE